MFSLVYWHKNSTNIIMAKVKYYYDSDTLSYRKIEVRKRDAFKKWSLFTLATALLALFFVFVSYQLFESPKEKAQKRELENLDLHYNLLNKKMEQVEKVLEGIQYRDNEIYRLYFEANPIPIEQRKAGFGGVNRYKSLEGFDNSEMIIDATKNMDILSKQLYIQSKSLDEIVNLAKDKESLLAAIPAIQPVRNQDLTRVASGYGWRSDPFTKARKRHKGMDFTAPTGTPIYATGNGKAVRVDSKASGFGNHIEIEHGYGYKTIYAHLSKYNIRAGKIVKRGDLIGFVGNTGRSVGPHLHYEVHKNGKAINPIDFYYGSLTPEEFEKILKTASQEGQSFD